MASNGKDQPGQSGSPATHLSGGTSTAGRQANPVIRQESRAAGRQFEDSFYEALLGHGTAGEVAALLWESARKREPWAVQAILQRLAPEAKQIDIAHRIRDEAPIDYSRLSDEDLDRLEQIYGRATVPTGTGEGGESSTLPEGVCDSGMGSAGTEH